MAQGLCVGASFFPAGKGLVIVDKSRAPGAGPSGGWAPRGGARRKAWH
ncbi:MAG: hypothetical protein LBS32_01100 [Clostridiales Family XIII bacterium]|nr:hypothetical protein [Clostridiales Family XIII bacterium]